MLAMAAPIAALGCGARASAPSPTSVAARSAAPSVSASAPARGEPTPVATAAPPSPEAGPLESGSSDRCGPFECRRFDSGSAALGFVLEGHPLALGIGEAHALAGSEQIASSARRFTEALLPELRGRVSHLVVELLAPDPRCETATREVRRVQAPVTRVQSSHNQSDYIELGRHARELGIEPFVLSPTCDEYRAIAAAGDDALGQMLTTIAQVTSRMLRAAIVKNRAAGRAQLVVGYGGALHNDIEPSPAKAQWSYGPELNAFTGHRYVELDLIVREFVKGTEAWRALPWYAYFDPARDSGRWLVMRTGGNRYVLFFPTAEASAAPHDVTPDEPR
jgi:hypothetical protein